MANSPNLTPNDWHHIFEQQFDLFYRRLVYMAGYIIKDRQEAHDIVIDVLLKIRSRLMNGKMALEELKPAYFKMAVNNACMDWLKAQRRQAMLDGRNHVMPDDPREDEGHRALLLQAIELIENLPRQQREVMTLIYFEGMSVQSVAENMRIAPSTVYQHRQAALKTLKERQMRRKGTDPEILLLLVLLLNLCKQNYR